jgi:hypothetical protein
MKISYPANNVVSLWIGSFPTEEDFDEYVDQTLAPLLRLPTHISAISEVTFEEDNKPIGELLEGFSGWETFISEAVAVASTKRVRSANAAVVCYYVDCSGAQDNWGKMTFIGTFNGNDHG